MVQRKWSMIGVAAIAVAALLWSADAASAQRGGRGGGGRGWGGGGWGGGWRGGGWGGGWRDGGWGWGGGWGWYGYPGYYGGYTYGQPVYTENFVPSTAGFFTGTGEEMSEPSANVPHADLDIRVPDSNAQVWLDDQPTRQRGTFRQFVTPQLEAGRDYSFKVHAHWRQNGKDMDETKTVRFKAGDHKTVNFEGQTTGKTEAEETPATQPIRSFPSSDSPKGTVPSATDRNVPATPNAPAARPPATAPQKDNRTNNPTTPPAPAAPSPTPPPPRNP